MPRMQFPSGLRRRRLGHPAGAEHPGHQEGRHRGDRQRPVPPGRVADAKAAAIRSRSGLLRDRGGPFPFRARLGDQAQTGRRFRPRPSRRPPRRRGSAGRRIVVGWAGGHVVDGPAAGRGVDGSGLGRNPGERERPADDREQHAEDEPAEVGRGERDDAEHDPGDPVEHPVGRVDPQHDARGDQQDADQHAEHAADADVDHQLDLALDEHAGQRQRQQLQAGQHQQQAAPERAAAPPAPPGGARRLAALAAIGRGAGRRSSRRGLRRPGGEAGGIRVRLRGGTRVVSRHALSSPRRSRGGGPAG